MASISSMISLIVVFLATYAYSVPVVSNLQNATSTMQVENATIDFRAENFVILARRDTSDVAEEKRGNDTVGLSSSSSEDESDRAFQTTGRPSSFNQTNPKREVDNEVNESFDDNNNERSFTEASFSTEVNTKRGMEAEDNESFDDNNNERSFTEASFSTEVNTKRGMEAEDNESFDDNNNERSFTEASFSTEVNTKRGIEVESFQSSTVENTSVAPSSQVKTVKRSSGDSWLAVGGPWSSIQSNAETERKKRSSGGPWLADSGSWSQIQSNAENERKKRSPGGSWLADSGSWSAIEADTETERKKRSPGGSWLADESNSEVQKRSFEDVNLSTANNETSSVENTSVPSTSEVTNIRREMGQSSSLSDEANDEFNRRAIGSVEFGELSTMIAATVQSQSSTDEQPLSSSTEVIRDEVSSTSDSETTVVSTDDITSSSPVPTASTAKILAIIPGKISRSQLLVNPATGTTAGFRPLKQVRLTQGQNQTVSEERKSN